MTMSRERLEGILIQEMPIPQYRKRARAEILAEFDRQAAINAQLLEACKHAANWVDAMFILEKHNPESSSLLKMLDAAIRVAETTSPPPPGVTDGE